MEVVRRGKDRRIFADIDVGDCFAVEDSDLNIVYMKIAVCTNGCVWVRALDITSGYVKEDIEAEDFISDDTPVIPVHATVVIEQ